VREGGRMSCKRRGTEVSGHARADLGRENCAQDGDARRDARLAQGVVDARRHAGPRRMDDPHRSRYQGTLTRPAPTPARTMPTTRCVQLDVTVTPRIAKRPTAINTKPAPMRTRRGA